MSRTTEDGRAVPHDAIKEVINTDRAGPSIEVRGVSKRFGQVAALDRVDLSVRPGEFVVLTGPSGAGKSTLIHLIGALERADAGSIVVDGEEITHHNATRYRRAQVGLIFQLHNLIPRLTARQNVEIAMYGAGLSRRQRRSRAVELLQALGLGHRVDAKPPTLSGGERQRVAIARALANRPGLVLADEPTGSLDDQSVAGVLDLFRQLREAQGVTIVAVTHDPRLTVMGSRLVRLEGGRIVGTGGEPAGEASLGDQVARLVDLARQSGLEQAADWTAAEWSRESAGRR